MRTRRSLFVFGALLAVGVLLAPQATFAQTTPSNVKLAAGTPAHSSITVTWSPGDSTVATYEVEWKKIADGATPTAGDANVDNPPTFVNQASRTPGSSETLGATARTYTITGLDAATTYAVAVRGLNTARTASNWILPSPAAGLKTAGATPQTAAPGGVNAVSGDKMVTVSWEAVTGATGYRVQYRTAAQSYSATTRMVEVAATATSAEVKPLVNGTEYMFRVTAKNAGGYGAASAEVKQTPAAMPGSLPSPTSVYLNASGRDQIVISWAHGKRADGTEDPTRIRYDVGWTDAGSGNDRFGASCLRRQSCRFPAAARRPRTR